MKLQSFRIQNYKSIKDTGWHNFSPDGITGLIGQNEAGKTSILDALYSFGTAKITNDIVRSDGTMPEVSLSFVVDWQELTTLFPDDVLPDGLRELIEQKGRINITRVWADVSTDGLLKLEEDDFSKIFEQQEISSEENTEPTEIEAQVEDNSNAGTEGQTIVTEKYFTEKLYKEAPAWEKFEDFGSLLPNEIDLEDLQAGKSDVEGYKAAQNLLLIAGISPDDLKSSEMRMLENKIDRINKDITADFRIFWRQKIGKTDKISIEFELKHHDELNAEKKGKPYLVFWIKDGEEKLYPKQRSKGVQWFTSFYLQLKANALGDDKQGLIMLMDEPGGSLHARAQEDVIKVVEEITKKNIQIIYTTHSPYLVDLNTIYRVLAVQRADEEDDKSETLVLGINELGSATCDTLSPLYTLMGVPLSGQGAIKKSSNVLLEEISAYYYIMAFYKLLPEDIKVNLLPATGVNNIPQLAYLFMGWGLNFGIVVDDESSGRSVYNELKKNLFLDDETAARNKIYKIKKCSGIEDIFTTTDFKKFVLEGNKDDFEKNSAYVKNKPKAVYALNFMLRVDKGEIKLTDLESDSQNSIKDLVTNIKKVAK